MKQANAPSSKLIAELIQNKKIEYLGRIADSRELEEELNRQYETMNKAIAELRKLNLKTGYNYKHLHADSTVGEPIEESRRFLRGACDALLAATAALADFQVAIRLSLAELDQAE